MNSIDQPVWWPEPDHVVESRLAQLMTLMDTAPGDYDLLYDKCVATPERLWQATLEDLNIQWTRPYERFVDLSKGRQWPDWFVGGALNYVDSCLWRSRHEDFTARQAMVWESEDGDIREFTYQEIDDEVSRVAAGLQAFGVQLGDRVAILLPNIPECVVSFLALGRIGAIVVPLYSGFGPDPVSTRLAHSGASTLITCPGFSRGGRWVDVGSVVQEAVTGQADLRQVVVIGEQARMPELAQVAIVRWPDLYGDAAVRENLPMNPNDPFMIIYTSGTTGQPKGTVHTHGGFPLKVAQEVAYLFDFKEGDRLLWYSDMGWMIGPMVICGALMLGGTLVLYDGAPFHPGPLKLFEVAARHAVSHFGSAPTLIRTLKVSSDDVPRSLLESLRILMTSGEVIDPETFMWYFKNIGQERLPIINYSGGTEVSGGILGNVVCKPIAPSCFNARVPAVDADIFDDEGNPTAGHLGELVIRQPFVGMTRGFWQSDDRYLEAYWARFPETWVHGDLTMRNESGYFFIQGRSDDVINVSGRRTGPSEIEAVAMDDPDIAAAAAVGVPDGRTGEAVALVAVASSETDTPATELSDRLRARIEARLGRSFQLKSVHMVSDLPRTRNAKIMRRLIRRTLLGEELGDISSLENPGSIASLQEALTQAACTRER